MLQVFAHSILVAARLETYCDGRPHLNTFAAIGHQDELRNVDLKMMKCKTGPFARFTFLGFAVCGLLALARALV